MSFVISGSSMRLTRLTPTLALASVFAFAVQWKLLVLQPSEPTQATRQTTVTETPCDRDEHSASTPPYKIYVYELPAKYNTDIAHCVEGKQETRHCQRVSDCGYGPLLEQQDGGLQVRNTWQFALEVIVHHRMLTSVYRTQDANEADAFYLPYYSGLDCLCSRGQGDNVDSIQQWLKAQRPFQQGRPHVIALGKIEREHFSQRCSLLTRPELKDFLIIGIEQEANDVYRRRRRDNARPLIVAPYPSYGHFSGENLHSQHHLRDTFVLLAAGTRRSNPFRCNILDQFTEKTTLSHAQFIAGERPLSSAVWYQTPECRGQHQLPTVDWMQHAVFCLQPPGDSPTRKSFYDAVVSGCVPVIFREEDHRVRYPFDAKLNYSEFGVELAASLMQHRTALDVLREIPKERIARMQQALRAAAPLLQYAFPFHQSPNDAFKMMLEEIGEELKRLQALETRPLHLINQRNASSTTI